MQLIFVSKGLPLWMRILSSGSDTGSNYQETRQLSVVLRKGFAAFVSTYLSHHTPSSKYLKLQMRLLWTCQYENELQYKVRDAGSS